MAQNTVTTGFSMYNPRRLERVAFGSFAGAGIDVFTDATCQDPNKFAQLLNVMPSISGGFQRRWGLDRYSIPGLGASQYHRLIGYAAAADSSWTGTADTRLLLGVTGTTVDILFSEVGGTPAYGLAAFPTSAEIYGITSRNWFYACNGKDTPQKVDYSQRTSDTHSRWGIPTPSGANGSDTKHMGLNDEYTYYACGGYGYTTGPTVTAGGTGTGAELVPIMNVGGIITGINVNAQGSGYTNPVPINIAGVGTPGDWEGVADASGKLVAVVMNGPITLNVGRTYAIALKNSVTGHVSDFIPSFYTAHYATSADTNNAPPNQDPADFLNRGCSFIVLPMNIPASSVDAQVDTVVLLSTADGGDLGHLYEVNQIPLSSWTLSGGAYYYTYIDQVPDTYKGSGTVSGTLLNNNLWVDTAPDGTYLGIFGNTPPPNGITKPVVNKGRMFATDGKVVYYSKSIDEVVTSTGLITSKWEEAWPATNQLDIAYDDEQITGLLSDGEILYIGTTDNIYRLLGDSASNFSIPATIFRGVGVKSQDAWSVVYKDNVPAGYVWVTPDNKVMFSDFNTYNEIGKPIYPLLNSLGSVTHVQSLSYGPYSFAVLTVANDNTYTYLIFDTKNGGWYLWERANDNTGATGIYTPILNYTNINGVETLYTMVRSTAGNELRFFSPSRTTDWYNTDQDMTIGWTIETSWINLKDTASDSVLNEIELWSDDPPTVSVYNAMSIADFASPPLVKTGTPVTTPFGSKFFLAGSKSFGRYHKVKFANTSGLVPVNSTATPYILRQFQIEFFPQARA